MSQARIWREGFSFLFGEDGILRRVWPAYKEYFREDFHPWQRDTMSLLIQWRDNQADDMPEGAAAIQ